MEWNIEEDLWNQAEFERPTQDAILKRRKLWEQEQKKWKMEKSFFEDSDSEYEETVPEAEKEPIPVDPSTIGCPPGYKKVRGRLLKIYDMVKKPGVDSHMMDTMKAIREVSGLGFSNELIESTIKSRQQQRKNSPQQKLVSNGLTPDLSFKTKAEIEAMKSSEKSPDLSFKTKSLKLDADYEMEVSSESPDKSRRKLRGKLFHNRNKTKKSEAGKVRSPVQPLRNEVQTTAIKNPVEMEKLKVWNPAYLYKSKETGKSPKHNSVKPLKSKPQTVSDNSNSLSPKTNLQIFSPVSSKTSVIPEKNKIQSENDSQSLSEDKLYEDCCINEISSDSSTYSISS